MADTIGGEAAGGEAALAGVIESARRLGVEIDEAEAAQWMAAMEAEALGGDIVVDVDSGIFGHRVSMLDFTARDLARFRAIGEVVGFPDRPPEVRTALALSGSAAQGKVQSFPGDCDYFERIHIAAPTREQACEILAREMRDKALGTRVGPTFRLWEVKFGSYPFDGQRDGRPVHAGGPVSWTADEVAAGAIEVVRDGTPETLTWDQVAADPGWCKLDWIVADPARRALANASNMLDVTWEAPDGTITALDGVVDPYFQEVYLEAESLPLFTRIVGELSPDAVEDYVEQLEHEVVKYTTLDPNHGKVARRLYNIFRLTGRYAEAVYLRELFDEPTTVLYQVAALIRTLDEADRPGAEFDTETMVQQTDQLIMSAISALEGRSEADMVRRLLEVRDNLQGGRGSAERTTAVDDVKHQALEAVNAYFERRLRDVPAIAAYLDEVVART
ncbi:MAG: hypothetical protein A2V85_06115 [Chloroflexi bacterium RBG_16_72_14]|nr:MAG: hypothetical protein A2V85_06115 [Chloroflexi bacterium RBG_16_72_14]